MDILQQAIKDRERTDGLESAKEVYDFAVKIFDKEYDDWLNRLEVCRALRIWSIITWSIGRS